MTDQDDSKPHPRVQVSRRTFALMVILSSCAVVQTAADIMPAIAHHDIRYLWRE